MVGIGADKREGLSRTVSVQNLLLRIEQIAHLQNGQFRGPLFQQLSSSMYAATASLNSGAAQAFVHRGRFVAGVDWESQVPKHRR
jgi:hypothetical protein